MLIWVGAQKVGAEGGEKKEVFSIDSKKDEWSSPEKQKSFLLDFQPELSLDFLKVTTWTSTTEQEKIKAKLFIYFFPIADDDFHSLEI